MNRTIVASFEEFHTSMREYLHDRGWLFRGHNRVDWSLVPKLGRDPYKGIDFEKFFEPWKRRAFELLAVTPTDDWDWLAIAQHHGLVTSLLDWSFNPLAAAFFAAYPVMESDCTIYAYRPRKYIIQKDCAPLDCKGIGVFKPRGVAARITRQGGIFTHHNPPDSSLEGALNSGDKIHQIVIKDVYRKELIFELDRYGLNKMTLFPDLDGLSEYCNWACHRSTRGYWTREGEPPASHPELGLIQQDSRD